MTNEEAIRIMQTYIDAKSESEAEALDIAIKALETGEVYMTGEDYNLYMEGYKAGKSDFAPKQGVWVKIGDIGLAYTCNKCGEVNVIPTKFCPNCGARMKGGTE